MSEEIKTQLEALECAVTGVNDVINLLEDIKHLHSKVNTKTEETLNKLSSVDEKIAEINAIRDKLLTNMNSFTDEINALKEENADFEKRIAQLENLVSTIETSQIHTVTAYEKNAGAEQENTTKTVISSESSALYQFFASRNCEVIDKRQNDGPLWILGEKEKLQPIIEEAKKEFGNLSFKYGDKGSRATKHKPGWYISDKR